MNLRLYNDHWLFHQPRWRQCTLPEWRSFRKLLPLNDAADARRLHDALDAVQVPVTAGPAQGEGPPSVAQVLLMMTIVARTHIRKNPDDLPRTCTPTVNVHLARYLPKEATRKYQEAHKEQD